ncbi:MAG TPA: tetratricopeptide repeat protein [Planctomycetota bacterium]|nr:tetratricopeptide repeat protein [Planctomycetota bacterium]
MAQDGRVPITESELALARLLVEQGLLTREHVEECLAELRRLAEEGIAPLPKLGEMLVRRGYLAPAQYEPTVRIETPRALPRERAADALPAEVAGADPGQRFGKYVRVRKLGAGGMGEVWKAWDLELARWVALKFLKGGNDEEVQRFVREAQLAGKLSHPHIAAVYDVGQDRDRHYIAMQFVDGVTLRDVSGLDPKRAARLLRDAARAVHYAHGQGIIHRDLKPDNLMAVERPGADPHVYVMDFGLARATEGASQLSASGVVVGTPAYMAPEQARGEKVDGRADVYSLGATLYELLRGRPPFESDNVLELLRKAAEEEPPPLEGELGVICAKAMEKDPARRYATAAELAEDLERWLTGEPILARRASVVYRVRKRLAKRKAVVVAAAALALAFGLGVLTVPSLLRARRFHAAFEKAIARVNELTSAVATGSPRRDEIGREAVRALEAALAIDPRRPAAWVWLGRCRRILGGDARECWERALAADPDHAEALMERGRQALEEYRAGRGEPEVLYAYFGAGLRIREMRPETPDQAARRQAGLRDLEAARRAGVPGHAAAYLEGLTAFAGGDFAGAERALDAYLDRTGWDARAYLLRARARRYQRKYREAQEDCERALRLLECDAEAHLIRGLLLRDQGKLEEAVRAFEAALAAHSPDATALLQRGAVLIDLGRAAESLADFARALELDPNLAVAYSGRGWALQHLGRLDEAERDYDRALALDPEDARTWSRRGFLFHYFRKKFPEALRDYTRAVELDPDATVLCNRSRVLRTLGREEEGERDLLRAVELDPKFTPAWEDLGALYFRRRDFERAEEHLSRAAREGSRSALVFRFRGYILAWRARWSEALDSFRTSCASAGAGAGPDERDYPRLWIALLRYRLGEREEAAGELRDHVRSRNADDWFARLALFVIGDLSEAELFRAARSPEDPVRRERECEAFFYAGILRLLSGDVPTAKAYFERVLATGLQDFVEYQGARSELERLK